MYTSREEIECRRREDWAKAIDKSEPKIISASYNFMMKEDGSQWEYAGWNEWKPAWSKCVTVDREELAKLIKSRVC